MGSDRFKNTQGQALLQDGLGGGHGLTQPERSSGRTGPLPVFPA